ncbi:MAG: hypothetical protein RJB66_227 [Pseudomonadota bacterium]|jgi:outer membrane lipoprotein-sorting protein
MIKLILLLTLSLLALSPLSLAETIDVQKILEFSDRTRGGIDEGLEWTVNLTTAEDGETSERRFFIKNKREDSFVESMAPQKYKGEVFVFNGRTIWFFKPGLRKPIAISSKQKLSGVASNGDIASTNYVRDYSGTFIKLEPIENEECYLLHLKSKANDTTYDQINYWVSKKSGLAIKSDFLSVSGKIMKTAFFKYQNKITYKNETYPFVSEMRIIDSKNSQNQSTLIYSSPKIRNHSTSLFNVNNLVR